MDLLIRLSILLLMLSGSAIFSGTVVRADSASCLSDSGKAAVTSCNKALAAAPRDIAIRFALVDALIEQGKHKKASSVLVNGLDLYPANQEIKDKLALTESYLKEQAWVKSRRNKATGNRGKESSSGFKISMVKCTRLKGQKALDACNKALKEQPDNSDLLQGKGNALLSMELIGDALIAYRKAQKLNPSDQAVSSRIRVIEGKRRVEVKKCLKLSGSTALKACESALLKGADDESIIRERRSELLLALGKTEKKEPVAEKKPVTVVAAKAKPVAKPAIEKQQIAKTIDNAKEETPQKAKTKKPVPAKEELVTVAVTKPILVVTPFAKKEQAVQTDSKVEKITALQKTPVTVARTYSNAPLVPGITY